MDPHPLKKPKEEEDDANTEAGEREEGLVALIEHRAKEVELYKLKVDHYSAKLEEAEKKLSDSKAELAQLRAQSNGAVQVKAERRSSSPVPTPAPAPARATQTTRPQLVIPSPAQPKFSTSSSQLVIPSPPPQPKISTSSSANSKPARAAPVKVEAASRTPPSSSRSDSGTERKKRERDSVEPPEKKPKRKIVQREHQDIIPSIRTSSSPQLINFHTGNHISSLHKRKLRCLVLSPTNDSLFATSALDGLVSLWQLQSKGGGASLLSTSDCLSPKQRRWPEDLTWHPDGDRLFSVYTGDAGDSQISILNLNSSGEKRVTFLQEKPHVKGIINSILFMPWDSCFATGGSDHAAILWTEKDGSWKPKAAHRNEHSSAVTGVAGLLHKKVLLSAGADKRIIGFDLTTGRADFKHQIESKCMSVLPNPSDFNLFMVQTGTPEKQLRLFDIRLRKTEIHSFGWKQESSESQSALINQAWSPDGFYISSGSADPKIHLFDIRYDASRPSQSVQAHQKRVFKAAWHQSVPMLISISSDLNIGLHRII